MMAEGGKRQALMEQNQVSYVKEAHRCPFCHEDVAVNEDDWVACKQCLARHHVGCWTEGNRCSSCQSTTPLVPPTTGRFRPMPTVGTENTPPAGVSEDAIRFITSQALDEEHRKHVALAAALLTPITLGVYPILASEAAFATHSTNNKTDERPLPGAVSREVATRLRLAREHAYDWSRGLGVVRAGFPSVALVLSLITCFVALGFWLEGRALDDLKVAYLCQLVALGAMLTHLHVFRETVRRHEFHQFFIKLVSEAVPPNRAKEVLRLTRKAWNGRRAVDVIITLLSVVPFAGLLLLPIMGARLRGALLLHEEHEDGFPRRR